MATEQHEIRKADLSIPSQDEADNIIRGTGWEDGKGCAIGCTLEKYDHARSGR